MEQMYPRNFSVFRRRLFGRMAMLKDLKKNIFALFFLFLLQPCFCVHIHHRNQRSTFNAIQVFELSSSSNHAVQAQRVTTQEEAVTTQKTTTSFADDPTPHLQAQLGSIHTISLIADPREDYENLWKNANVPDGTEGKSKIEVLGTLLKRNVHELRSVANHQVELVFLVDSSSSVGVENFFNELKFVKKLLADFTVAQWATRVAIITFSSRHRVKIVVDQISKPSEDNNKCSLLNEQLPTISYVGGGTHTLGAFLKAQTVLQHARPNSTQAVFLITDGYSNGGDPQPTAEVLRNRGVEIFTFGIKNGNVKELLNMASKPSAEHCYILDSFEEFEALARRALHEDLYVGGFIKENRTKCSSLCTDGGDCCDVSASCQCGTHTGQYECVCPAGHHGTGLQNGCIGCPIGTYKPTSQPGGISTCRPCPSQFHTSPKGSFNLTQCVCQAGYRAINNNMNCEQITCPALRRPENGFFVTGLCLNNLYSGCAALCTPGYALVSDPIRVCQEDGTWTGSDFACQMVHCEPLAAPANGTVDCSSDAYTFDTVCTTECDYGFRLIGSRQRRCMQIDVAASWDGLAAHCKPMTCTPIDPIPHGYFLPPSCTKRRSTYGNTCRLSCDDGYTRFGTKLFRCGPDGTWRSRTPTVTECVDTTRPEITCPVDIMVHAYPNRNYANITWEVPFPVDEGGGIPSLKVSPSVTPGMQFRIGKTVVTYHTTDMANNTAECSFSITVKDTQSPTVEICRSPPVAYASRRQQLVEVSWDDPEFSDNSGLIQEVSSTHRRGSFMAIGSTNVEYIARDAAGNIRTCNIQVNVQQSPCDSPRDPYNGQVSCVRYSDGGLNCTLECNPGYQFAIPPTSYICHPDGTWYPSRIRRKNCQATYSPLTAVQTVSFTYPTTNCSEEATQQLRDHLIGQFNPKLRTYCGEDAECDITAVVVRCNEDSLQNTRPQPRSSIQGNADKPLQELTAYSISKSTNGSNVQVELSINGTVPLHRNLHVPIQDGESFARVMARLLGLHKSFNNGSMNVIWQNVPVQPISSEPIPKCNEGSMFIFGECVPCAVGMFFNTTSVKCQECPKGYYQPNESQVTCIKCEEGKSTEQIGSITNSQCKGFCPPGTRSASGLEQCENCQRGKYQPNSGATECFTCRNGTTTETTRSAFESDCKEKCPPGYSSATGLQPCLSCPVGMYQHLSNQMACILCPNNGTTPSSATDSKADCEVFNVTGRSRAVPMQVTFTPCFSDPCQHRGTCEDSPGGIFCSCVPGYEGRFCETEKNECVVNQCLNNGSCVDGLNSFQCVCQPGFSGGLCEVNVDECLSNPCNQHSICLDEVRGYTCECSEGYEGIHCEFESNECASNPCFNGGICVDRVGVYECKCTSGYYGNQCKLEVNECQSSPCQNGAVCTDLLGEFRCECQDGYEGLHCEVETNECETVICLNNGTCEDKLNSFKCHCAQGFVGDTCEEELPWNFTLRFKRRGTTDYSILRGEEAFKKQSLHELTISFWMRTLENAFDKEYYSTPFSYAVGSEANDLTLTDVNGFVPTVNGKKNVTDVKANDLYWHHIAFTWRSLDGRWRILKDGSQAAGGFNLSTGQPVQGGGDFVLGQEQDSKGGGFNPVESFVGDITMLNIWSRVLTNEELWHQSRTCDKPQDVLIGWPSFLSGIKGDVEVLDNHFCEGCAEPVPYSHSDANASGYQPNTPLHSISYVCSYGYEIRYGNITSAVCQVSGEWLPSKIPECLDVYCLYPSQITHGIYSPKFETPYFGHKITYVCDDFYTLIGQQERVCQRNKQWQGEAPACVISECGDVPVISNSSSVLYHSGPPNLAVKFSCADGFRIQGDPFIHCTPNGSWSHIPHCEKITCQPVKNPYFGDISKSNENEIGSLVTIKCNPGFLLQGNNTTKCQVDGTWSSALPICKPVSCDPLPSILNSNVSNALFTYNVDVVVACDEGYRLQGDPIISCSTSGSWDATVPRCDRVLCGNPPIVQHSLLADDRLYTYQENVTYSCKEGYKPNGSLTISCSSQGTWQPGPPSCFQVDCGAPPFVGHANYSYEGFTYGNTVSYSCHKGFQLERGDTLTCSSSGVWEPLAPSCEPVSCDHPPYVKNAYHTGKSVTFGSIVRYSCVNGYVLRGENSIISCFHNRSWVPLPPKCEPLSCGHPPNVSNAVYNAMSYYYGNSVNYTCQEGYYLIGQSSLTCSLSGEWDPLPPMCYRVSCGEPPIKKHSTVIRGYHYFGDEAVFECNTGYYANGSLELECNSKGLWIGDPGECEPVSCGEPPMILNGLSSTVSFLYQRYVTYDCHSGYNIGASSSLFCNASGHWEGSVPSCSPISCPKLAHISYGSVEFNSTTYGEQARYQCDEGYDLLGKETVECTESGRWSFMPPSCRPVFCLYPEDISNGYFVGKNFHFNHSVFFYCNSGFNLIGAQNSTCLASRRWSFPTPTCEAIECPTPIIFNGIFLGSSHRFNHTIQFVCDKGFNLRGSKTTSCLASGTWDHVPVCEPIFCDPPEEIPDGSFKIESLHFNSHIVYFCNDGFTITGNDTRTCLSNGQWSLTLPTCDRIWCGTPPRYPNSHILEENFYFGDKVNYHCDHGYKLLKEGYSKCLSSGNWSSKPPLCGKKTCKIPAIVHGYLVGSFSFGDSISFNCEEGYDLIGSNTSACLASAQWSSSSPSCEPVMCNPVPLLENGRKLSDAFHYKEVVSFACDVGYRLEGTDTITCMKDRSWNGSIPSCLPVSCGTPPDFDHGFIEGDDFTFRQSVVFRCDSGYNLEGPVDSVCLSDGTWSNVSPTCLPAPCKDPEELENGEVHGDRYEYPHGVEYSCHPGYDLIGTNNRTCQADGLWSGNKPICYPVDCGDPPSFSRSTWRSTGQTFGHTVSYACDDGYELITMTPVICNESGHWTGIRSRDICVPVDCGLPPSFHHMYYEDSSYTFNSTIWYNCEEGFQHTGPSSLICHADGSWGYLDYPNSLNAPSCVRINCGTPPRLTNGRSYGQNHDYNSSVIYFCNEGFRLVGDGQSICMLNGSWSVLELSCEAIVCQPPLPVLNSTVSPNLDMYSYLAIVTYECNYGYLLRSGDRLRVCVDPNVWDGNVPYCHPVSCGTPPSVRFSTSRFTGINFRHTITYSCHPGYYLIGSEERTCQGDGTWSGSYPFCVPLSCRLPETIVNGEVSVSTVTLFSTANYTCNIGYELHGRNLRTCGVTGRWSGDSPLCQPVRCNHPERVENGFISLAHELVFGSEVFYSCYSGYRLIGEERRVCQHDGTWNHFSPVCTIVSCPLRPNLLNGSYQMSSNTSNSTLHYSCNQGYILQGEADQVCLPIGRWSSRFPRCVPVVCSSLRNPYNGEVLMRGNIYQSQALYICEEGFQLVGPQRRECLASGLWSDRTPSCHPVQCGTPPRVPFATVHRKDGRDERVYFFYQDAVVYQCNAGYQFISASDSVCSEDGSWQPQDILCHKLDCGAPPGGTNLLYRYNDTSYNSEVVYSCPKGFLINGAAKQTCAADGTWSPTPPVCERMQCPLLLDPPKGSLIVTGSAFEDVAIVRCNSGFRLKGNSTLYCTEKGIWDSPLPTCEVAVCPEPLLIPDGERVLPDRESVLGKRVLLGGTSFQPGSAVFYICNSGFLMDGPRMRVCWKNGTWSGVLPVCRRVQSRTSHKSAPVCVLPCLHGGQCVGPYQCNCPYGFAGARCERVLCKSRCVGGAMCMDRHQKACSECQRDGSC